MAEFLNRKKLIEWIPHLIESSEKELIIISPYIQISEKIFNLLKTSEKKGVEITLIYKEGNFLKKKGKNLTKLKILISYFTQIFIAK